jgi:hypothetical protein
MITLTPRKQYDFKRFHDMLRHVSIENTKNTVARLGIKLTGRLSLWEDCLLAKMREEQYQQNKFGNSRRKFSY